jgi:hypothetical protein
MNRNRTITGLETTSTLETALGVLYTFKYSLREQKWIKDIFSFSSFGEERAFTQTKPNTPYLPSYLL